MAAGERRLMSVLEYYLTFIHYFGFSVNPTDTRTHYLALRRIWRNSNSPPDQQQAESKSTSREETTSGGQTARGQPFRVSYKERDKSSSSWLCNPLLLAYLEKLFKFLAICLTGFLALNHLLVLIRYIYDDEKSFIELMFHVRLVLTKLSALIFILSWHYNQKKVRQLIKLIKSTSIYILGTASSGQNNNSSPQTSLFVEPERKWNQEELFGGGELAQSLHQNNSLIEGRVLRWWALCLCVTLTHFGLSEAEILSDRSHLWQWLDDYSFSWLSNQTISHSELLFLATLDNYIYTVHSYGARLFGASIICLVCSLQSENIFSLKREALELVRASDRGSSQPRRDNRRRFLPETTNRQIFTISSRVVANNSNNCERFHSTKFNRRRALSTAWRLAGSRAGNGLARRRPSSCLGPISSARSKTTTTTTGGRLAGSGGETNAERRLFFILGESDWFEVCENTRKMAMFGYLSSTLVEAKNLLLKLLIYWLSFLLWLLCEQFPRLAMESLRGSVRKFANSRGCGNSSSSGNNQVTPSGNACSRAGTPNLDTSGRRSNLLLWLNGNKGEPNSSGKKGRRRASVEAIEWQLERLVNKYELVRTVNARIDACFGPMLLIQFSFLFLLSCMDLVYFSISFNPTTRTKYIIMSGMVLLWLPYILMYKYASDIASSSKELLLCVRHLARLSIIQYHSEMTSAARQLFGQSATLKNKQLQTNELNSYLSHLNRLKQEEFVENIAITNSLIDGRASGCANATHEKVIPPLASQKNRVRIINKLDHVFEPIQLSLMGITSIDKFFLLNFTKIVITTSVMIIQFITN